MKTYSLGRASFPCAFLLNSPRTTFSALLLLLRVAFVTALTLFLEVPVRAGGPVTAAQAWVFTAPPAGVVWNDFHVVVKTDTRILYPPIIDSDPTLGGIDNLGSYPILPDIPPDDFEHGMDTLSFFVDNAADLAGKKLILSVEYQLKTKNGLTPFDPYYTNMRNRLNLGPTLGGNPHLVGFDVSPRHSPSVNLTLINPSVDALMISDLSWAYRSTKLPDGGLVPFSLSGLTPLPGQFEIPGNSSLVFNLAGLPREPGYIVAQGVSVNAVSGFTSEFIIEHEEVPDSSGTLALLGASTFIMLIASKRLTRP